MVKWASQFITYRGGRTGDRIGGQWSPNSVFHGVGGSDVARRLAGAGYVKVVLSKSEAGSLGAESRTISGQGLLKSLAVS